MIFLLLVTPKLCEQAYMTQQVHYKMNCDKKILWRVHSDREVFVEMMGKEHMNSVFPIMSTAVFYDYSICIYSSAHGNFFVIGL